MDLSLTAPSPFSLESVVRSHGWIRLAPFAEDEDRAGFCSIMELGSGRVVGFRVSEEDDGVRVKSDVNLDADEAAELAERVTWMLGLEQDFSAFYARCKNEPKLAHVEAAAQGRLLRSPTLFEDFVKTILTTNTAWSGTIRMTEALVEAYGALLDGTPPGGAGHARAFPSSAMIAQTTEQQLRDVGKLGYRAPYILELAQRIESGDLEIESSRTSTEPTPELRKRLLAIKGIGGYASASLLMLLGRYNYLPVDSWARKMVSQEWYDGQPVGADDVEAAFADWGEWKGLVYWFWDWEQVI